MDKYKELLEKICREDGLTACVLVTQKDIPDDKRLIDITGYGDNLDWLVNNGFDLIRKKYKEQEEAADGTDR